MEPNFCTLCWGSEHIKGKSKSDMKKPFLLLQLRLWEALQQPHLDRPESSAHFSAAVLLCNFQVSPPTPEDQQSALQLPQVVSVPWREGTAIAALQVTKIRPSIKSIRAHMMDWQRWESWESEEHYQSKSQLGLINPRSTDSRSFVVAVVVMVVTLVLPYGPVFSMRTRKTTKRSQNHSVMWKTGFRAAGAGSEDSVGFISFLNVSFLLLSAFNNREARAFIFLHKLHPSKA